MSARLQLYRRLEREMLDLEAAGDPYADQLRDVMDPLWYALSDEEHAELDGRSPAPSSVLAPATSCLRTESRVHLPGVLVQLEPTAREPA